MSFTTFDAAGGRRPSAATSITSTRRRSTARATRTARRRRAGSAIATTNPGTCNDTFGTRVTVERRREPRHRPDRRQLRVQHEHRPSALSPGTTYYYCAIANNAVRDVVRRACMTFTTPAVLPSVSTSSATAADQHDGDARTARHPGRRDARPPGSATARPTRAAAATPSARASRLTGGTASRRGQRQRPVLAGADGPDRRGRPTTSARSRRTRVGTVFGGVADASRRRPRRRVTTNAAVAASATPAPR